MAKKSFTVRLTGQCICAVFLALSIAASTYAELTPLENTDMDDVWGSAGITIAVKNLQIFNHIDYIRYTAPGDTSYPAGHPRARNGGYIEFKDFMMGGIGNPAKFNYDFGTVTGSGVTYIDVGEVKIAPVNDWSGTNLDPNNHIYRGMVGYDVPVWDQELSYTIGSIRLFDPEYPTIALADPNNPLDLGSFYIGLIDMPRYAFYISPPSAETVLIFNIISR